MEEKEVKKLLVSEKVTRDKLAVSAGSGSVELTVIQLVSLFTAISNTSFSNTRSPCIRIISSSRYYLAQYIEYI